MKLRIFDEKVEVEDEVFLKLVRDTDWDDCIEVVACDRNGNIIDCGYLIAFNEDGRIDRYDSINSKLGFDLDEHGRIKEVEE